MLRILLCCLLFSASPLYAQLTDYFGILAGYATVVQDNYDVTTGGSAFDDFGWIVALNRTYPVALQGSIALAFEVSARQTLFYRQRFGSQNAELIDLSAAVREFAFSIQLVHSPRTDRGRFFIHSGPEISYVSLRRSPYQYDYDHWHDLSLSMTFGGGFLIPISDKELVFDVRYNSDLTKAVDDSERFAPIGSRFDELHLMFGIHLPPDFFRIRK